MESCAERKWVARLLAMQVAEKRKRQIDIVATREASFMSANKFSIEIRSVLHHLRPRELGEELVDFSE